MPQKAPFNKDPQLTAIVVAYKNPASIADAVLPRVTVTKETFKYGLKPIGESFNITDSKVGRKGVTNEVEYSMEETEASVESYGLEAKIPQADIDDADDTYDPVEDHAMGLSDDIALGREQRVASAVFDSNNYAAANVLPLSGSDQFNDFANSDPIGVILEQMDKPLMRPNQLTMGRAVLTKLSRHPDIVKAVNANSGDKGVATLQAMAELFQVERILVGQSRHNTAKKGQNHSLARLWGNHISGTYIDPLANTQNRRLTYGFTAQRGTQFGAKWFDRKIGLKGGQVVRVGEEVRELIIAPECGFLLQNVISG